MAYRTPRGPIAVSWRWEVGMPLFVVGIAIAIVTVGIVGAGVVFWVEALMAAVGAAVFLSSGR